MLTLVFLALYALVAFFKVNRAKSLPWMVGNIAFLGLMGIFAWMYQNVYFGLGVVAAVANVANMYFGQKLPLSGNVKTYVKALIVNVLFYPVELFEELYSKVAPKL